ncbi:double-strand break repair protein AddB [Aquibaculum arenosum]|uniref:Double-strand break repair protein AddB n=1 Tax=Aquibaculum arenosum TaxID=3032591 RepID=A0ABT5YQK1_9PROT|nr:double-strand break repair protein AddB [Fodinicurvata sp. CAU 1616]MDF2096474.1 double-strand break repair protein AddB [Fodinicurvata sp. CAU 1616]
MPAEQLRISSIPSGVAFVDTLARGLLWRFPEPEALAGVTLLLPTRRACRALRDAFLRVTDGAPLLLPRLLPLGDLDADELLLSADEGLPADDLTLPQAVPPLLRQLQLARLIVAWGQAAGRAEAPDEERVAPLAQELARLIDQVDTEGLDFTHLKDLVPERYAEHWGETLRFLEIVATHWPLVQEELGYLGPAERRRRLHEAQVAAWISNPPDKPIIAAGSTGSIPSTAALLGTIAALPQGEVVLPGLDRDSDAAAWASIAEDPAHPQHTMARLLAHLGVEREAVGAWPGRSGFEDRPPFAPLPADRSARNRLLHAAMLPAAATQQWSAFTGPPETVRTAFAGVTRIEAETQGEEATAIALLLREALETPERTAALVTPDRALARRVAAELARWDIAIDDSAGRPLTETEAGSFLRLTAAAVWEGFAPVPLLACLKHPLAAGGVSLRDFHGQVRALDRLVLRGPRPAPGIEGLRAAQLQAGDVAVALTPLLDSLENLASPFMGALREGKTLTEVLAAHIAFAEGLASSSEATGAERLWSGEEGEAAADFLQEFSEAAEASASMASLGYPALLDTLLAQRVVRPRFGRHPRLAILGPIEARLQQPDLVILGSLVEGTWPSESDPGPWLSRPMRVDFGLPPLERRVGLAAHDFVQALGAEQVVLTRARKVDGTPTVPSRWLLRLEALFQALGVPDAIRDDSARWAGWAQALDRAERHEPQGRPAPRPPLPARPTRLPVTGVEEWIRDPYSLYARRILRLRKLDPLDADPSAADRGSMIHSVLEGFVVAFPEELPEEAEPRLLELARDHFEPLRARPGLYAFWWPRFQRIAAWIVQQERQRRATHPRLFAEVSGRLEFGGFVLTAKADRIEQHPDGSLTLVDYKTGSPPSGKEVLAGYAPQLPLEAAIAATGGFPGIPAAPVAELLYWKLTGGTPAGEECAALGRSRTTPSEVAEIALEGLRRRIEDFADPQTPYPALPRPGRAPRFNDYAHLARHKEWASFGGENET